MSPAITEPSLPDIVTLERVAWNAMSEIGSLGPTFFDPKAGVAVTRGSLDCAAELDAVVAELVAASLWEGTVTVGAADDVSPGVWVIVTVSCAVAEQDVTTIASAAAATATLAANPNRPGARLGERERIMLYSCASGDDQQRCHSAVPICSTTRRRRSGTSSGGDDRERGPFKAAHTLFP
jgi:hypothetical protein